MPFQEKDYLKRQLDLLAKLVAKLMGLKKKEQLDEARDALHGAAGELLGMDDEVLRRLDPPTVARLLGTPQRLRVYADLVATEARLGLSPTEAERLQALERTARLYAELLLKTDDAHALRALGEMLREHPVALGSRYEKVARDAAALPQPPSEGA